MQMPGPQKLKLERRPWIGELWVLLVPVSSYGAFKLETYRAQRENVYVR